MDRARRTQIRRVLYTDPAWAAYAIADMQAAVYDTCEWYLETGDASGVEDDALIMLYPGLQPPILFATGTGEAVSRAMARMVSNQQPPSSIYYSVRPDQEAALQQYYDNSADRREMYRMRFTRKHTQTLPTVPGMKRLMPDDALRVKTLFTRGGEFSPDAFSPWQVTNGVFYGIEDSTGALIAVGGTHIVDWDQGVGAVGSFYTHASARNQGYASAILNAVVNDLRVGGVDLIVLNVDQRNGSAARLYEHNGFSIYCPYLEGKALLKR